MACLAPGIPNWHFLVSDTSLGFPKGYLCLGGVTLAWLPKSWVVHPNQSLKNFLLGVTQKAEGIGCMWSGTLKAFRDCV